MRTPLVLIAIVLGIIVLRASTYVLPSLTNKPTYSIVNEGADFNYYETLEVPGLTNYTHVMRETTIESISDSTSTFSQ